MAETRVERRLAAVLAADVFGYSRLMGADEEGTLAALKTCRREIIDPKIAEHRGRVVKTTGDGVLVEFASAVDAVRCAIEIQRTMAERNADIPEDSRIILRIGINVGDIIIDEGDIYGDGVNTAARLETLAAPGAICLSENAYQQVKGKLALDVRDMGEQQLKNIAQPVRVYYIDIGGTAAPQAAALALPDKPSIAVLPYQNMSCDPEQDYFADGIVEDIITAMSRFSSLFVIARNSSFTYKGKHVDIKQVGRELGVRYVLEGSVRKSGDRLRVTAQLIDAETGAHVWAETYDRKAIDIFGVQDEITQNVVGAIEPSIRVAEIERSRRKRSDSLNAYDLYLRALPLVYSASRAQNEQAVDLLNQALAADPSFASAATAIGICFAWRAAYGWGNTAEAARQSAKYAQLALELDRENSSALALLARLSGASRKYDEAVIFGQRAVSSNPIPPSHGPTGDGSIFTRKSPRLRKSTLNARSALVLAIRSTMTPGSAWRSHTCNLSKTIRQSPRRAMRSNRTCAMRGPIASLPSRSL
jgi:adenylate cyclase